MAHNFDIHPIVSFLKSNSYLGVFILTLFGGYLIPAPEAVLLMLAGYVASFGFVDLGWVLMVCVVGGILGDSLLFGLSYSGSKYVERFRHRVKKSKLEKYEHYVADHIGKAIFFLRFIVGVRFFAPVVAGSLRVSWRRFLFYEALAATINAVLFVGLGYLFRRHILVALTTVEVIKNILFLCSAVIISVIIGYVAKKEIARCK